MFSIKDRDVSLADIKSSAILYMAVKDLMFYPSWKPPRLPVAYQEVEYIEAAWNPYIDTWYVPTAACRIYAKAAPNKTPLNREYTNPLFCTRKANSSPNNEFAMWISSTDDVWYNALTFNMTWTWQGQADRLTKYWPWEIVEIDATATWYKYQWEDCSWQINPTSWGPWTRILLFGLLDWSTVDSRKFYWKLYSFRIWESWTLVRDYVPCYRKEDNVVWLYDLVTNEFYINSWSWSFTRWDNIEYSLPKEYSEVYYIKSTATNPWKETSSWQYIDTDYIPNKDTKITIDMNFDDLTTQSRLFAIHDTDSSYMTMAAYINWSSKWARAMKNWEWDWVTTEVAVDTGRHTFTLKNWNYKINTGNTVNYNASNGSTASTSARSPLPLLAAIEPVNNNRIVDHSSAKIYWCTIFESEVMVRNLIPCIRKKDKKPWLYDFVTKRFFVNVWTGEFTYWAEKLYTQTKNTVAYYPLENDTNDYSWNKKNLTNNWITFTQQQWFKCAYDDSTDSKYARWTFALTSWNNPFTISCFAKSLWKSSYQLLVATWYASWTQAPNVFLKDNEVYFWWWTNDTASGFIVTPWVWYHIVFTFDWTTGKLYVNNELKVSRNVTYSVPTSSIATSIGNSYIWNQSTYANNQWLKWYMAQLIFEDYAWDTEKIDKYYNSMKDYMKDDWNDFQEVEYIYRDWSTQAYIDTKWKPSWGVWFKEEIWLRFDTSWQRHCFLASWWGSSTYPFSIEVNSWSVSNNKVRFYSENSALSSNNAIEFFSSNAISTWEFHDVSITSSWTAVVDWVTTTWSLYSWSNNESNTQLLFIDRDFRWSIFNRNHYVSYLKIYENNVLVRDFVPCYRISDNVIWMFDKVNSIFYTNNWSWTFWKWPRVIREREM